MPRGGGLASEHLTEAPTRHSQISAPCNLRTSRLTPVTAARDTGSPQTRATCDGSGQGHTETKAMTRAIPTNGEPLGCGETHPWEPRRGTWSAKTPIGMGLTHLHDMLPHVIPDEQVFEDQLRSGEVSKGLRP